MCGSGGIFFFSQVGAKSVGLDNRFPLTHCTSILSAPITSHSLSHRPVRHRGACAQRYLFSALCSPRPRRMVSRGPGLKFVLRPQDPAQGHRPTGAALAGVKRHLSESFLWGCGASLSLYFGNVSRL